MVPLRSDNGKPWIDVVDGEGSPHHISLADAAIVWHGDHGKRLPPSALRPGLRIRCSGDEVCPTLVEIVDLGPHAMEAVVEGWVVELAGGLGERVLGDEDRALIAALGAPCWAVRSSATTELRRRGFGAIRVLPWAARSTDPEVGMRARVLMRELGWD